VSAPVNPNVRLFDEEGYPFIAVEIGDLLDRALRVVESEPDPVGMALALAKVLDVAADALRDLGADVYLEQRREAS